MNLNIKSIAKCFLIVVLFSNNVISQCVNVALNKPATGTGKYLNYTVDKAFDGDCGTPWNSGRHPTASIQVDLQQTYTIEKIVFRVSVLPNGNETYKIYTSSNMSTWTEVDYFTVFVVSGDYITRSYTTPLTNVRGVKLECTQGPSWTSFFEIGVYSSANTTNSQTKSVTICSGDSVLLSASGGTQYLWSTGATTKSIYAKKKGVYRVISSSGDCLQTAGACSDTTSFTVDIDTVIAKISPPVAVCKGDSLILSASGGTGYLWSTGGTTSSVILYPDTSGTYSVTVSEGLCSNTDTVTITVNPLPTANAGRDTTICRNDNLLLIATGGITYSWSTGDTASSVILRPDSSGSYTVIVSDGLCSNIDTVVITVNPLPIANAGNDTTICLNSSIQLQANGGVSYQWNSSQDLSNDLVPNPTAKPSSTTSYILKVTDNNNCIAYDTVVVSIDTVDARFTSDLSLGDVPLTVNFQNNTGGGSFEWTFGDDSTSSNLINPIHIYESAGNYRVRLIAYSAIGCSDTAYNSIQVNTESVIWIPNAFTPNGDGKNDVFSAVGKSISCYSLMIFNRWGELLFTSDNINNGWNGTYKGKPVPDGVYVWKISYCGIKNNSTYEKTGHVTLLK